MSIAVDLLDLEELWKESLQIDSIDEKLNYFESGGASLQIMNLIAEVNKKYHCQIDIKRFFQNPTYPCLRELVYEAMVASAKPNTGTEEKTVPFQNDGKELIDEIYQPLSPTQELIYLDILRNPQTTKYNITQVFEIKGELDVAEVERAVNALIEDHDILLSNFKNHKGKIVSYKTKRQCQLIVTEEDIEKVPFSKMFDLEKDLLIRFVLVKNTDKTYLIFDAHHLVLDGSSVQILLSQLHHQIVFGEEFSVLSKPDSYSTYVDWYVNHRNSDEYQQKLIKTCEKLLGYESSTLPAYKLCNDQGISYLTRTLKPESKEALEKMMKKYGKSDFVSLLSVFYLTMYAFTGNEKLLIGTPAAVRNKPEFANMIGMFVNSIPLNTTLSMNQSIQEYLNSVAAVVAEGLDNQEVINQDILHYLKGEHGLERNHLFSTLFLVENKVKNLEFEEFSLEALEEFEEVAQDQMMTFRVRRYEQAMLMDVNFDSHLYHPEMMDSFFKTFEMVLKQLGNDEHLTLQEVSFISTEEKQTLKNRIEEKVSKPNNNLVGYHLFEKMVKERKDEICIESFDEKKTWGEIHHEVCQVVQYLNHNFPLTKQPIGLSFDRHYKLFVAILAVLKMGRSFVALDKKYDEKRQKEIIQETDMEYILADEELMIPSEAIQVINIKKLPVESLNDSSVPTVSPVPEALMTVVFSSGTTGRPKGIEMTYENFSLLHQNMEFFEVSKESRILSITNYTFDVFLTAISFMLYNGATLVLTDDEMLLDSNRLAKYSYEKDITHICCPTSIFHSFKERDVKYLRNSKLLCAGERIGYVQSKMFYDLGHTSVYNGYGPAESCVYTTYLSITKEDFQSDFNEILIGKPLKENVVLIIDEYDRILPKYASGEMVIYGKTLSPGYYNQKDLTEEKFSSTIISGYRGYKTRDLAVYVNDDNLMYIDRMDSEIKVRGYRVNTRDVIRAIEKRVDSSNIVVFAENQTLLCFIESNNQVDINEVMNELKQQLPSYMIPSLIQLVKEMPYNHNGKVDKQKLLSMMTAEHTNGTDLFFENETEEDLYHIWKKILGNGNLDRDSNFFSVGGHSLKIMELQYEIESLFGVKLPTNVLFEEQTIGAQAKAIEQAGFQEQGLEKHEFKQGALFPLTPFQESLYTLFLQVPKSVENNIVLLSKIKEDTDIEELKKLITQEIEQQPIFKTRIILKDDQLFQMYDDTLSFRIEEHEIQDQDQLKSKIQSFDLNNDMLIKVGIIHGLKESYLLVNVHHILFDGESAKILVERLIQRQQQQNVEEPDFHFFDYAKYLENYRESEKYKEDQDYWQHLEGIKNVTVPYDFEEEFDETNHITPTVTKNVPEELHRHTELASQRLQVPKISLLLAAFHLAVGKASGEKAFAIGTSVGLRMHYEVKQTIGPFVNTLPIYSQFDGDNDIADFVQQVNHRYIQGMNHIRIGFPEMVKIARVERNKMVNPLFNVMFIYHPASLSSHDEIERLGLENGQLMNISEKFDLTMNFLDLGDQSKITITYDHHKYREQTMIMLIQQTMNIVSQMGLNTEMRIRDLQYETESERKILASFPQIFDENISQITILDYWNQHVQKYPDQICIEKESRHFTFKEVDQMANYVVSQMQEKGVKPFESIGFLFDRSIEMYVSLIASLKLGVYYVPLEVEGDPSYLYGLIQDAEIKLVLTEDKLKNKLPEAQTMVVSIRDTLETTMGVSYSSNATLALLYTSGTTGKPKGILISHDNMINLSNAVPGNQITREDTLIQIANYTFDISSVTFFNAIIKGARLILCQKDDLFNIERLVQYMIDKKVTYVFLPTAIFHLFDEEQVQRLRNVTFIAGGEVMSKPKIKQFLKNDSITIYNMYGPTETSVYSTIFHVNKLDRGPIPIGHPVVNTVIRVLNDDQEECGVNEIGELYIGGRGVSKGYLKLEEETKRRFVTVDGMTFYKTGDFVKITSDGQIEFKGRRDKQVKINGYRIELHEIENAIKKECNIKEITIIYYRNHLIAFIADEFDPIGIQNSVKKVLASYKCPNEYVKVNEIPLTLRGKIDEKKLIGIYEEFHSKKETLDEPLELTTLEQRISELWAEVLKRPVGEIDVHDNFFDIGGSSIQAISLVSKMRKENLTIQFEDLLTFQTIKEMSGYLTSHEKGTVMEKQESVFEDAVIVLPAYMEETMYKEVFKRLMNNIEERQVYILDFYYQEDYLAHYTNLVQDIVRKHKGRVHLLGYSFGGVLAHEIAHRLKKMDVQVDGIIMLDSYYARGKNFYKKMLRGTFISKRAAIFQLERAYPQFKEIDSSLKLELIEKFESFYKLTNQIMGTAESVEIPLYFIKSDSSMKGIEDTRGEWEFIYQEHYTEWDTTITHTNMMKLESIQELSTLINEIFVWESNNLKAEVGSAYGI